MSSRKSRSLRQTCPWPSLRDNYARSPAMPEGRRGPPRSAPIVPRRLSGHVLHDKPARCCPGAASRSPLPLLTPVRLLRLIINIFAKDLPDIVCVEIFPHLDDEPILEFQHMMVCVAVEAPVEIGRAHV